jgi:Lon protease-like protein
MQPDRKTTSSRSARSGGEKRTKTMQLPLFPLKNVVLFPGMVLPLHIFEMRYREMINRCIDETLPFGVLLIQEGEEVGEDPLAHAIGTAARIMRVERLEAGRMNITAVGTQRFRVKEFHHDHSYATGTVEHLPFVNGGTKTAEELAHKIRPRIIEYVDLLGKASRQQLKLDRLPEEPTTLAFMVAIALQVSNEQKQTLLSLHGIPEMLAREVYLLSREVQLLQHMFDTQAEVLEMSMGPTGYIFPN